MVFGPFFDLAIFFFLQVFFSQALFFCAQKPFTAGFTVQGPAQNFCKAYLLGLLAKIKCSICSYQLNLWYVDKCRHDD